MLLLGEIFDYIHTQLLPELSRASRSITASRGKVYSLTLNYGKPDSLLHLPGHLLALGKAVENGVVYAKIKTILNALL